MLPALEGTDPLAAFDGLLNLERSRAFHEGRRPVGLEGMAALFAALPPAPRPVACVHVAGSEGKTSTTERIGAGLLACGLRTGTYTSPHLVDPRERLRIDFALPAHDALRPAVEVVLAAARTARVEPTWFEALTATACVLFAQQDVQAAVWETGLGGRLDATAVLPADVCVITTISLEHTAILGASEAAIAREKAGILRPGQPLVVGPGVTGAAFEVVAQQAARLGCPLRVVGAGGLAASGDVQYTNTALACAALEELARLGCLPAPPDERVRAAVGRHVVAGRHDLLDGVLYDGAHTVASVARLAARLAQEAAAAGAPAAGLGPVIFGATHGRDAAAMARSLLPVARPLILTRAPGERGVDPVELAAALACSAAAPGGPVSGGPVRVVSDPRGALVEARRLASGPIVVTGSLHLVGLLWPRPAPPGPPA